MHQNLFQTDENAQLLIATIFKHRDAGEFLLHDFVVMPNHLHALLSVRDGKTIGRAVQLIKGGFSHALHQSGGAKTVWQPGYYEHRIRDHGEHHRIRNCVTHNPVRRNLVAHIADYRYSSAAASYRLDEVPEGLKPANRSTVFTPA
jgi:putative transposase